MPGEEVTSVNVAVESQIVAVNSVSPGSAIAVMETCAPAGTSVHSLIFSSLNSGPAASTDTFIFSDSAITLSVPS